MKVVHCTTLCYVCNWPGRERNDHIRFLLLYSAWKLRSINRPLRGVMNNVKTHVIYIQLCCACYQVIGFIRLVWWLMLLTFVPRYTRYKKNLWQHREAVKFFSLEFKKMFAWITWNKPKCNFLEPHSGEWQLRLMCNSGVTSFEPELKSRVCALYFRLCGEKYCTNFLK